MSDQSSDHPDEDRKKPRPDEEAEIDEAGRESFPASDPPAWSGGIVGAEPEPESEEDEDGDTDR